MKLLFDENLSPRLAVRLADLFPASTHVREIGLQAVDDPLVWEYARLNGFLIVSKDADMHDLSLLFGNPSEAVIATLGLNPSRHEFLDPHGRELTGNARRFETLTSLGVRDLSR